MESLGKYPSSVTKARKGTASVQTTVPIAVAKALNLKAGDRIEWDIRAEGDRRYALVARINKRRQQGFPLMPKSLKDPYS